MDWADRCPNGACGHPYGVHDGDDEAYLCCVEGCVCVPDPPLITPQVARALKDEETAR